MSDGSKRKECVRVDGGVDGRVSGEGKWQDEIRVMRLMWLITCQAGVRSCNGFFCLFRCTTWTEAVDFSPGYNGNSRGKNGKNGNGGCIGRASHLT